jgi:hypothetical protein
MKDGRPPVFGSRRVHGGLRHRVVSRRPPEGPMEGGHGPDRAACLPLPGNLICSTAKMMGPCRRSAYEFMLRLSVVISTRQ